MGGGKQLSFRDATSSVGALVSGLTVLEDGSDVERGKIVVSALTTYPGQNSGYIGAFELAMDGSPVTEFGDAGRVQHDSVDHSRFLPGGVAVDAAGVVYASYNVSSATTVASFGPDGAGVPTFGAQGTAGPFNFMYPAATLRTSGGALVVVVHSDDGQWEKLARLTPGGTLDPEFGTGGIVETPLGETTRSRHGVLQADDRIVVVGDLKSGGETHPLVSRYWN